MILVVVSTRMLVKVEKTSALGHGHIGGAISATWSLRFGLDLLFLSQPAVSLRLQLLTRRSTPVVTRQSRGGSADHGLFP